ncbi:MAG: AMP-binding protein [Brachybacterium sp.]|uniref:AMP-binding protein n=1 Tax=Brachybacterium sp. TaxID=1891286 RepID=UPI0026522588|nr:acyl-CoA synthetase [Brachybacterium sp.]MDN6302099.1 acyl-CoA synthetase [Brachybacterium sp.]MDN6329755.1 acyl-CoA synthetase [Brachybacterium sp.]
MKVLPASTALRARVALRPHTAVLMDHHGALSAGELLDLVHLHRRRHRGTPPAGLGSLPATAPLRQVLVTVLAGNGVLELRSHGSTGPPHLRRRGPLTAGQLSSLADLARRIGLRRGRRIACLAPGVHGHGLMIALGALALGAPLVDLTHLPGPERVALLHHSSPDLLTGVPVHLVDLLRADTELAGGRTLRIPHVVSGSDLLTPDLRADLARHYRAQVHDVYGTSGTGPLAVDGRPLRGVRLRAADGLLHARTPFTGRRELVTDRGEILADGTVDVLGRADGAVSSGGMLPDPGAVVRVLRSHPAVAAARLRAVPDDRFGVRTVAEVELAVRADGIPAPSSDELRALIRDRLGAASVPHDVLLSDPGTGGLGAGC